MDTIDTHLLGHIFVSERNIDKVNAFDKYLLKQTIFKILIQVLRLLLGSLKFTESFTLHVKV